MEEDVSLKEAHKFRQYNPACYVTLRYVNKSGHLATTCRWYIVRVYLYSFIFLWWFILMTALVKS